MNTLYLYGLMVRGLSAKIRGELTGNKVFVIGVKNRYGDTDLDNVLKKNPEISLLERLPETYNPGYIYTQEQADKHVLQPAFITIKKEA